MGKNKIFNKNFYPTPESVMAKAIKWGKSSFTLQGGMTILEPSAGKGDFLDFIKQTAEDKRISVKLFACEIDPNLRLILEGKGYPIMAEDFLTYSPTLLFDAVIMNPPFDHVEEHVFHAWEITREWVISVIPNAALEGKTAQERQLINLIEDHGSIENLGVVKFAGETAPVTVDVSIIWLKKEKGESKNFTGFNVHNTYRFEAPEQENPKELALEGFVNQLLAAYNASIFGYEAYIKQRLEIERFTSLFNGYFYRDDRDYSARDERTIVDAADKQNSIVDRYNTFVMYITSAAWRAIFDHPGLQAILTDKARKMFNEFIERQRWVDFNAENIKAMIDSLVMMKDDLMDAAILEVFDELTKYHPDNREYIEGWKSNDKWIVRGRVVLPNVCRDWYSKDRISLSYSARDRIDDIDRVMSLLSGRAYNDIVRITDVIKIAEQRGRSYRGDELSSSFFTVRAYKKGTIHLRWQDQELLKKFNYEACKAKKWLPEGMQYGMF